jgi:surfeit locus 1 family protein
MSHPDRSWRQFVPLIATGLACALLLGLGTWQMQRKGWKEQLLAAIDARGKLPPVQVKSIAALGCEPARGLLDPCEFLPVSLAGQFLHAEERHIFIAVPRQANGIGGPGYWVMTPFRLGSGDAALIGVNRGFVPLEKKSLESRGRASTGSTVEIAGLLRRAEPRATFSGANDVAGNVYYVRDPRELWSGLTPSPHGVYYVDMTAPMPAGDLPYPLTGRIPIANRHLEYALTWYALAATLMVVAFARFRRGGA